MWVRTDDCGLVANNLGPVADIVGWGHRIVAANVVPSGGFIVGPGIYVCRPLVRHEVAWVKCLGLEGADARLGQHQRPISVLSGRSE